MIILRLKGLICLSPLLSLFQVRFRKREGFVSELIICLFARCWHSFVLILLFACLFVYSFDCCIGYSDIRLVRFTQCFMRVNL